MSKLKSIIWGVRVTFAISPWRFFVKVLSIVLKTYTPILLTLFLGKVLNIAYEGTSQQNNHAVIYAIVALAGLLGLNAFLNKIIGLLNNRLNLKNSLHLKKNFFDIYKNIPAIEFEDSNFCDDFENAKTGYSNIIKTTDGLLKTIIDCSAVISTFVIVFKTSTYLAFFTMLNFSIGYFICMKNKKATHTNWVDSSKERRYIAYLDSLFVSKAYAKELRVYGIQDYFLCKWSALSDQLRDKKYDIIQKSNRLYAIYYLIINVMGLALLFLLIALARQDLISIGSVYSIWNLNNNISVNVEKINTSISEMYFENETLLLAKKLFNKYKNPPQENSTTIEKNSNNKIQFEFENVFFSYKNSPNVLKGINLKITEGETIALCGNNGSGKSTLIKILLQLFTPTSGSLKVNGEVINKNSEDMGYGVAFQDYVNYPLTVKENIGLGYVQQIDNTNEILIASQKGEADLIINKYGLDTVLSKTITNDGVELSGGEWQKLALSRASFCDKLVLVFDEPTAKLDPVSELNQYIRLNSNIENKTTIIISHRIGFAKLADRIIVMEDGRILEDGSHDELIKLNGKYKEMYDEQSQWYDLSAGAR